MTLESDLNRVIEAIDKLRTRKNRPNLPAIARYLLKTQGFPSDKTVHLLDTLLVRNRVKEVVYKGNISFRNMLRWRQPSRPSSQKLEAHINSSVVVSTMQRLLAQDREATLGRVGVTETRLQAALIERLDGAMKLNDIRKQIQFEVDKGTIEKSPGGEFILMDGDTRLQTNIDLDMDALSDWSEALESSPETTNEDSLADNSLDSSRTSLPNDSDTLNADDSQQNSNKLLQNLIRSIDNVVNNVKNTKDSDIMTEPGQELGGKIIRKEITCQLSDKSPSGNCDNKRRRVIRKKTIYDPSEFELTPLVRRPRRRGSNTVVTVAGRERGTRSRRGSRVSKSWSINKDTESFGDLTSLQAADTSSDSVSQDSLRDKPRARGKPPAHINKKCCVCSSPTDKNQPSILSCSLCLNIAHRDCIKEDSFYEGSKKWRCEDCKVYNPVICSTCELEPNRKQVMLMCDFCEEFFHADCHYPPVQLPLLESTWRCSTCPVIDKAERVKVKIEEDNKDKIYKGTDRITVKSDILLSTSSLKVVTKATSPPIQTSQNSFQVSNSVNCEVKIESAPEELVEFPITFKESSCVRHKPDEPIPLVDDWTVQQVSDYFLDKFGQDVADAFQAQEIDGKLLMQMSRQYVTNDLGLQLGIALKVLYYVKKIQLGTNLLHQLWA